MPAFPGFATPGDTEIPTVPPPVALDEFFTSSDGLSNLSIGYRLPAEVGHGAFQRTEMIRAITELGLEGIIAKRQDSLYESGKRSAAWGKYKVNQGQLVVGGYTPGNPFDCHNRRVL
jgi:ATP-dependent DNA ligase